MTQVGALATLDEPRFSDETAKQSLWRPLDFLIDGNAGLYFLEPYSANKIPVLFVHGINGTPKNFSYLIEQLDRTHFQPWVVYYPSGAYIENVAQWIEQMLEQVQAKYKFDKIAIVAHSMGGLVSRSFILKHLDNSRSLDIPLFISIATPWDGHNAAKLGVDQARIIYGVPPGEHLNLERFLDCLHPEDLDRVREAIQRSLLDGGDFHEKYRVVHPDDSEYWIYATGRCQLDASGRPERMMGSGLNVTETCRNRLDLEHANDELKRALDEIQTLKDQLHQENVYLRREMLECQGAGQMQIVNRRGAMRGILDQVEQVAPTTASVLIIGETGRG